MPAAKRMIGWREATTGGSERIPMKKIPSLAGVLNEAV